MNGSAGILSGLQVYQTKEWVLRSWRDVFVDLVQGQLQFLFLSLLAGMTQSRASCSVTTFVYTGRCKLLCCCAVAFKPYACILDTKYVRFLAA